MLVKHGSMYVGRLCDETDRSGDQCELSFGHDGGTHGDLATRRFGVPPTIRPFTRAEGLR